MQRRIVFILLQIPPPASSAAQPDVNETESRHWIGQKTSNQETTYEVEEAGLFTVCSILISICSTYQSISISILYSLLIQKPD